MLIALLSCLFVASVSSNVQLKFQKTTFLLETVYEDTYIISGYNDNDFNIKKLQFRINPELVDSLKIMKVYEGNTLLSTNSTFSQNSFTVYFQKPKRAEENFNLKISLFFFKPFKFVPYKISVKDDQMIEYSDNVLNLEFDDDVELVSLQGRYVLPNFIHHYSKNIIEKEEGIRKDERALVIKHMTGPVINSRFSVYYTANMPFEVFRVAKKQIDVSMWGNLALNYYFDITNDAAEVDGEISNIDFAAQNHNGGKNTMRYSQMMLNRDISMLSIRDEVGNMTRCFAGKGNPSELEILIVPRFSLFGQWNSTYMIDYNQKSIKSLFVNSRDRSVFKLEYEFEHPLSHILSKEFSFTFCLPEFSELISTTLPPSPYPVAESRQLGFFEYFGKNCFTHKYDNVLQTTHQQSVSILFRYNQSYLWWKLGYIITVVTFFFAVVFALVRIDLSFDASEKVKAD
jgi:hypothetical protein